MRAASSDRIAQATSRHLLAEATGVLTAIQEGLPDRPDAMAAFTACFSRAVQAENPVFTEEFVIGTLCLQVPEELIRAAGAVPLRLCSGARAFERHGAEILPARSCPVVKATVGFANLYDALARRPIDLVIVPTTCDQKRKAGEMLLEMGRNVTFLEVPPTKDTEAARFYWRNAVKGLALGLERVTGRRITARSLTRAIGSLALARRAYRRLWNLLQSRPPLLFGTDAFLVTNAYRFERIAPWTEAVNRLCDELAARRAQGLFVGPRHAPRVLFTGSPPIFPNLKVPLLAEQAGAIIVADEVCSSSRMLMDAAAFDERSLYDLIPAVADRALKPCTCPSFVPNQDRRRRLFELAERFAVEGVIYQSFSGCSPFEMEQRGVAEALRQRGIPMLAIETDYSPEDTGQLTTRIEAFVESLQSRRKEE